MRCRPAAELALLAATFAVVLAWPLRSPAIVHHGEAREGLVVQAIVDRGEWVLPRRNGELPSKPPLFHWLAAGGAALFGLSDATLRLPSAIAAFTITACTLRLGHTLGGAAVGWLAVGALLGMAPFFGAAVEARVDAVFTAALTAALTAFLLWYRTRSPRARAGLYIAIGAAVLAKGPAGAVLPFLVIVALLVVEGRVRLLRSLWSWPLVALVSAVVVGWYTLAAHVGGRDFLALQLWRENWSRFAGSAEFQRHARGATLRLPIVLATQFLPWTLVLPWTLRERRRGVPSDAAERFLHLWWLIVLVVFSIGAGKRPVYLLPVAPAIALLAARALVGAAATPSDAVTPAGPRRRPALVTVALAVIAFDVAMLGGQQLVRELKAPRRSWPAFAATVDRLVPEGTAIPADAAIRWSDRMVLAYRLRRPVPAQHLAPAAATVYLAPATTRAERWCRGDTVLADSGSGADDVALMRSRAASTGDAAPARASWLCRRAPEPASHGGPGAPGAQESAGPAPVLFPLGQ